VSAPDIGARGSHPKDRGSAIERLLVVADAAVAEVDGLPPAVRALIDDAAEVYVVTPALPGRSTGSPMTSTGFGMPPTSAWTSCWATCTRSAPTPAEKPSVAAS
jgi:hypothetical protein